MPEGPMPGMPMPGPRSWADTPVPTAGSGEGAGAASPVEQGPSLAHDEPAVPVADQAVAASGPEHSAASSPNGVAPAVIASEPTAPSPPADPSAEGVGGG